MCGIAGFHVRAMGRTAFDRSKLAAELLLAIDHRGGDATGYAAFTSDGVQVQKAACDAPTFLKECRTLPDDARTVLLHTRFATQGKAAFPENNHPVCSGSIHVVHNGHINNDHELFGSLSCIRQGFVDSEAIPAVVHAEGWDNIPAALGKLDGAMAIAMANEKQPGELVLAKGEWSPLHMLSNDHLIVWASEITALLNAWERALGTPPAVSKVRTFLTGDMLHVRNGALSWGKFIPLRAPWKESHSKYDNYTYDTVWDNKTQRWVTASYFRDRYSSYPASSSKVDDTSKLETALAVLDAKQKGTLRVWNDTGWQAYIPGDAIDPDRLSVRCGCCDDWTDPIIMDSWAGELLCPDCFHTLTEELIR